MPLRTFVFLILAWTATASGFDFYDKNRAAPSETPYGEIKELVSDSKALEKFIEAQKEQETSALLISKDGKIYVEKYWDVAFDEPVSVHSITKSITSLLIGRLVDDGRFEVQDKAKRWFSNWGGEKEQITVQQLLTHTSGLPLWSKEKLNARDRVQQASLENLTSKPGSEYNYSNAGAYLLGEIIHQDTKDGADIFANKKVFEPLGIVKWDWSKDPTNHVNTSGGLRLTARDLLKIGVMMSNEGRWKESQIVSSKYVHEATDWNDGRAYGYLWWTRENVFFARGDFGQTLAVFPKKKIVVVRLRKTEILSEAEDSNGRWDQGLQGLSPLFKK